MGPTRGDSWRRWRRAALAVLAAASGHACATGGGSGNAPPERAPPVDAALADAAARTGLARDALRLVLAEHVTWRDGSLGCPEPGMMFPQALSRGFRITIEARGEVLDYHADERGTLLLCPTGRAVAPLSHPSAAAGGVPPAARPAGPAGPGPAPDQGV
jgi:hypothetical protein